VVTVPVEVVPTPEGGRIRLRVKPGGREDRVLGELGGALKVEVTAPPERGKANAAVVRLVSAQLGVGRSQVTVVSGAGSQNKVVEITGVSAAELAERLCALGVVGRVPR
jgi:uncharacterized protein (TIGR00251 family)